MCQGLFGGSKNDTATTPSYIPPAQTVTTGGAVTSPGVQVKGQSSRFESRNTVARARGGSGGQVDNTASIKRRRSASLGL